VLDHVEQRVPRGHRQILTLVDAILAHAYPGGGEKAARPSPAR
jgi:hypothetical protein